MCYCVSAPILETVTKFTSLKPHSDSEKYILIHLSIHMGKMRLRQVKQFAQRYSLRKSQSQIMNLNLSNHKAYTFFHYLSGFQTMFHKTYKMLQGEGVEEEEAAMYLGGSAD